MIFVSIIKSVAFLKFNVPTGFTCYVYNLADNQRKINCIGSKHTRTFQNLLANMHIKMVENRYCASNTIFNNFLEKYILISILHLYIKKELRC